MDSQYLCIKEDHHMSHTSQHSVYKVNSSQVLIRKQLFLMWLEISHCVIEIHGDMNAEIEVMLQYLMFSTWSRAKSDNKTMGYTIVISVSASYSRHYFIAFSSWYYNSQTHVQQMIISCMIGIYSIDIFLYPYTLLIDNLLYPLSSLCLSCNLSSA